MNQRVIVGVLASLIAVSVSAQQRPPIRQIGSTTEKASEALSGMFGVRHLPNGAVLVNDIGKRRVILFDPALASFTVVADSTSATANAYSGRTGGLIAYRGDSTLFVDPSSLSMLVIDGGGKIARVMSVPRSQDAMMLGGGLGGAVFDGAGRLVYRTPPAIRMMRPAPGAPPAPPDIPDSAAIVRVDLATRQLDTLGFIKTPTVKMDVQHSAEGRMTMSSQLNPLPVVDDWAVLSDGSIALVRGRDYHIDWIRPDGSTASSAKIPFEWQRLTDEDKVAFIDSVRAARERMGANAPGISMGGGTVMGMGGPGAGGGGGSPQIVMRVAPGGGDGGPPPRGQGGGFAPPQMTFVPASELPDYKPPFFAGSVRADADGRLWIRTIPTEAIQGGPVYDVVDGRGELVERVQVPADRAIVGFGAGGVVYLSHRDGEATYLERARVR